MGFLPKYFDNLKLQISAITGEPRIASVNPKHPSYTDKYKTIDEMEWILTLLNYFYHKKNPMFNIASNWTFFVGGKAETKEQLIKYLETLIEQVKKLPDNLTNEDEKDGNTNNE